MKKTRWKIDETRDGYRGTLYIIRKWKSYDGKPDLIERKLINVSDIPFYMKVHSNNT
jgi:hypothetical protein